MAPCIRYGDPSNMNIYIYIYLYFSFSSSIGQTLTAKICLLGEDKLQESELIQKRDAAIIESQKQLV